MNYLYLYINLGCLLVPFLFSFYPKTYFFKEWKWYIPATVCIAIVFVIWDHFFTKMGIWGFNPMYVTGFSVGELPIEEILFFICIPYASVFTYYCLSAFFSFQKYESFFRKVTLILGIVLLILGSVYYEKWYTTTTFLGLGTVLLLLYFFEKKTYVAAFFVSFLVILVPFFLSNGILTGSWIPEEVVWYNNAESLGIRIKTIPVEDVFYGMLLLLLNVVLYENIKHTLETK